MSHGLGFFLTFFGLAVAATSYVMAKFDLDRFLHTLDEHQVNFGWCTGLKVVPGRGAPALPFPAKAMQW